MSWGEKRRRRSRRIVLGLWAALAFAPSPGAGQITLDGSLGPPGALTGPDFVIGADLGRRVGDNLFHSFSDFNLATDESATFTGPPSLQNIIGRVTGGRGSYIDGRLSSTVPGANLYLINPAGVMFGPNASLDLQGSFTASTADYVRLGNVGRFDETSPGDSLLTTAPPSAFGFVTEVPQPITLEGSHLSVPEGKTLSLIGGDVTVSGGVGFVRDASLQAPAGRIDVASVAGPGEVIPNVPGQAPGLDLSADTQGGRVTVADAELDVDGNPGGTIFIRGGRFDIRNGTVTALTRGAADGGEINITVDGLSVTGGGQITTGTEGSGHGGSLTVNATGEVSLAGSGEVASGLYSRANGTGKDAGNAGAITVNATDVNITDSGRISASSFGAGRGADITVHASDAVAIVGADSAIVSNAMGSSDNAGDAGAIAVDAPNIRIGGGAEISSSTTGPGTGALVTIRATDSLTIRGDSIARHIGGGIFSSSSGIEENAGAAGAIVVETTSLNVSDGGQLNAAAFGVGSGGPIIVRAMGDVSIVGESAPGKTSGIFASVRGAGDAGAIDLHARNLTLDRGGTISSTSLGAGQGGTISVDATGTISISGEDTGGLNSAIVSDSRGGADGAGNAGSAQLSAQEIHLLDGGRVSSRTTGPGNGGAVTIVADVVAIDGEDPSFSSSGIFTNTSGAGAAGRVEVTASKLTLSGGGLISASTSSDGSGGRIDIKTKELTVDGFGRDRRDPSGIVSNATGGGNGGDIDVRGKSLALTDGAVVAVDSEGVADAGRIAITEGESVYIRGGAITAAATAAFGGSIELSAGSLLELDRGTITTSVAAGNGDGGNIAASALVTLLDQSRIIARADVGNGGNIRITSQAFVASADSVIDASSSKGLSGSVAINSPDTNIAGALVALPQSFLNADALLAQRCAARNVGNASSFVVGGSEAVPVAPDAPYGGSTMPGSACP